MIKKYRKKTPVVNVIQWTGKNINEIQELASEKGNRKVIREGEQLFIPSRNTVLVANIGDYIIQGVSGDVFPCKHDFFKETYDEV